MNNDEAKFLLSAFRPGGEDASDPHFTEAVAQTERDPALRDWFREERRFDTEISAALEAVPLPANLRANILAGGKISRPRLWSGRRAVLALAAGILLLAALSGVWWQRTARLDGWQRDSLAVISQLGSAAVHFDLENKDASVLRAYLQEREAPAPILPVALQSLPALGCKTFQTQGWMVSIICFQTAAGDVVHLAVKKEERARTRTESGPRFVEEGGWKTASWNAHGLTYMLATKASEEALRAALPAIAQLRSPAAPLTI